MPRILITDDSSFMRELISDIVKIGGYKVEFACTGEELLWKYGEFKPDIVILDIIMPKMNGLETLDKLMIIDPKAKVLICSGIIGEEPIAVAAAKKGAYGCIRKPFSVKDLLKAIQQGLDESSQESIW